MTPNIDATRNDSAPTQLHIASSHGLQSSPLNRLPAEIRNMIWDMVLTNAAGLNFKVDDRDWRGRSPNSSRHPWLSDLNAVHTAAAVSSPQISWALSLMATCRQLRSETKDLLLHLNDINIHVGRIKMTGGRELSLHGSVPVLKAIPRSLGSDNGRVVLLLQQGISEYRSDGMLKDWTVPKLEHILSEFAQTILPFRLFIALDFCFVAWTCGDRQVCGRDVPLTFDDCVSIRGRMPWGDSAAALRIIDETIDCRLSLLRSHGAHRMCAVRAMRRKWESGLEVARQYMQDIVYLIFEFPDDMADVMGPRRVEVKLRALKMRQRRRRGHVVWNSDSEYDDEDDDSPDEDAEEQDDEDN